MSIFSEKVDQSLEKLYEDALDYLYEKYHLSYSSNLLGIPLDGRETEGDMDAQDIADDYNYSDVPIGKLVV